MDLGRLAALGTLLLEDGPLQARLVTHFTGARHLLEHLSIDDLIATAFRDRDTVRFLLGAATRDIHLGFIVPNEGPRDALTMAASAAGFSFNQTSFPSTIMSRDLGERLGRRRVETQIFKAYLKPTTTGSIGIEAFIPETDPDVVRGWIRDAVGTHIAIGLGELTAIPRALELTIAAGFVLPPFMQNRPLSNIAEDLTAFYADGATASGPLRLEFFHSGYAVR